MAESGSKPSDRKPVVVKYGINHVVKLVEQKKAVSYCIIKGKARLGKLVHKKTATAVALTGVRSEDQKEFANLVESCRAEFNEKYDELRKKWGGGIMGLKSQAILARYEKQREKELLEKMKYRVSNILLFTSLCFAHVV